MRFEVIAPGSVGTTMRTDLNSEEAGSES